MRPELLNQFYNDEQTRNELIEFIHNFIDQEAISRVYNREDVSAVADARELIDLAFSELQNIYEPKNKVAQRKNQSR
jgi:hypothetical protein